MSKVHDALDAGRKAVVQSSAELGMLGDPAGQEHERKRLRDMGKWRFILLRGIIGFSGPMFLWLVLTHLSEDVHAAREFHRNTLFYLLHSWVVALFLSAFMGSVVGLLAWRRLVSEVWPGAKPDPESSITTLGPLSSQQ
jgi:hypothetical protein